MQSSKRGWESGVKEDQGPAERGVAAAGHRRQPLQWLEEDGRRKKEGLGC